MATADFSQFAVTELLLKLRFVRINFKIRSKYVLGLVKHFLIALNTCGLFSNEESGMCREGTGKK